MTYIPKVGVAVLAYWMSWYCLVSGGLSVVWSSILYVMVWIGTMWHWLAAPHHCIAYRTVFWVRVVLVLNAIRCSCHHFLDKIIFLHDFHHDSCDYFMAINNILIYSLGFLYISSARSSNVPWMFPPLDILLEYWIEYFFLWTPLCHVYIHY